MHSSRSAKQMSGETLIGSLHLSGQLRACSIVQLVWGTCSRWWRSLMVS